MSNTLMEPVDENSVNYKRDQLVDINNLHEEWRRQSALSNTYNKLLAQAENELDKAKERLEVNKAETALAKAKLELRVRQTPGDYNVPKKKDGSENPTEGWISNTMIVQEKEDEECINAATKLIESQEALIKANLKVSMYTAGVKTICYTRKSALEQLVFLWSREYFSVPKLPRPLLDDYQGVNLEEQGEAEAKIRQAIQPKTEDGDSPTQRRRRK